MPVTTLPRLSRRAFGLTFASALSLSAQSREEARWALLADTHIPSDPANGHRGFKPVDNLRAIAPQVAQWKPDAAIICGDVARTEGLAGDYAALREFMSPVFAQCPVAMALGNHDHRTNFLAALGSTQQGITRVESRDLFTSRMEARHVLSVDAGPVRMVILDTLIQANFTPGFLGTGQRAWLAKTLDEQPSRPTLLFVHHTLDDQDGALLDAQRLFDIIKTRRQVKAIFYGHSHEYKFEVWEGIHLINIPAVGYNFRDSEPVGWLEARFRASGGTFTLRALAGNKTKDNQTVEVSWRS
jgi:3',5'-cyclic AMP phosphodiesterase CpdA